MESTNNRYLTSPEPGGLSTSSALPVSVSVFESVPVPNIITVNTVSNVHFLPPLLQSPDIQPACRVARTYDQHSLPSISMTNLQPAGLPFGYVTQTEPLDLSLSGSLPLPPAVNRKNSSNLPIKKRFSTQQTFPAASEAESIAGIWPSLGKFSPERIQQAAQFLSEFPALIHQTSSASGYVAPSSAGSVAGEVATATADFDASIVELSDDSDGDVTIISEPAAKPRTDLSSDATFAHHQRLSVANWQRVPELISPEGRTSPSSALDINLMQLSKIIFLPTDSVLNYHYFKQMAQLLIDNDLIILSSDMIRQKFAANQLAETIDSGTTLNVICKINELFHGYIGAISNVLSKDIDFELLNNEENIEFLTTASENLRNHLPIDFQDNTVPDITPLQSKILLADRTMRVLFRHYLRASPLCNLTINSIEYLLGLYGNQRSDVTNYLYRIKLFSSAMHTGPIMIGDNLQPSDINCSQLPYGTRGLSLDIFENLVNSDMSNERLYYIAMLSNIQLGDITKTGEFDTGVFDNLSDEALRLIFLPRADYPGDAGYALLDGIKLLMTQAYDGPYQTHQLPVFFDWIRKITETTESDSALALMLFSVNKNGVSPIISFIGEIYQNTYGKNEIIEKVKSFFYLQRKRFIENAASPDTQPQTKQSTDEFTRVAQGDILSFIANSYGQNINVVINNVKMHYSPVGKLEAGWIVNDKSITVASNKMTKDKTLGNPFTAKYEDNYSLLRGLLRHFGSRKKQTVDVINNTVWDYRDRILNTFSVAGSSGSSQSRP